MIGIIDYGLGNVTAIANLYNRLGISVTNVDRAEDLGQADKFILPGVGAFDQAMGLLESSGMRPDLDRLITVEMRPILGICVGMQLLAERSEEGSLPGLGWLAGDVKRFNVEGVDQRPLLPHMGWNEVRTRRPDPLFANLDADSRFYFLHSYHVVPRDMDHVLARTEYIESFASSINSGNITGVQFHPEKSHRWGIQLLKNFAEL